ncbi:MAG: SURF1 family cytochrome oxidase biogenesis protein [Rothia sp. (in: high G+C Gram-positive bacteria)]|uniref:SURF1 family cytochrome oxidase biogenesis protein n=1 Tax=Rothia sp. (in: high G+C Gram-positive bacteria) TaxID=1885016 RepID=UPI002708EDB4|nr:SURF1 family cytochrome oxidase biogenesis protein [Rothia sp. (in: high G+C Gram-positive bacteria)]
MLKTALTPRWLLGLLLVLVLASGFVMLSKWQINASTLGQVTADPAKDQVRPYSRVLQAHDALNMSEVDTVVEATGSYVPGSTYLVENKLKDGAEGYWLVSLFVPDDSQPVSTSLGEGPRGIVVARAWTPIAEIPSEPTGTVTIAGRVVGNDAPLTSRDISDENRGRNRVLASVNSSYLTNVWNAALFNGILTLDSENTGATPITDQGTIAETATLLDSSGALQPIRAQQVTDDTVDWLNIFYALEWLVFAGFALYLWYRLLKDSVEKTTDPTLYFEYEGQYWVDEETGRPYYWDPADQVYYYFDDIQDAPAPPAR